MRKTGLGAAQHRDLVPQHEQFRILERRRTTQQDKPASKPHKDQIEQTQRHGRSSCPTATPHLSRQVTAIGRLLAPHRVTVTGKRREPGLLIRSGDARPVAVTLPCAARTLHGTDEGSWPAVRDEQCVNWARRAHDGSQQTQRGEAPDMTAGDHFERVAVVYESLRTTDEAPVRTIGQFLPGRPVTGLDAGCGTGRYSRLLRELLPDGSRLAASDDLVTAFNCVHHFDLGRFLAAAARVLRPGGQLFIYTRTPQQNARTIWGRYFPGFTEHEQRLHTQATLRDAIGRTGGLTVTATQTFGHPRSSTAERLRAQAEGRHYSTFSLYTPQELRVSTATFLARLPGPEVCWVDEHLLLVAAASRPRPGGA